MADADAADVATMPRSAFFVTYKSHIAVANDVTAKCVIIAPTLAQAYHKLPTIMPKDEWKNVFSIDISEFSYPVY